jgi:hypothetical protein
VADVTIRNPSTLEERTVDVEAVPFFVNQGYVVLDSAGRVNSKATSNAADTTSKEK